VVKGLETFPETLLMLFDGRTEGKPEKIPTPAPPKPSAAA
jgi:hypothetical protein